MLEARAARAFGDGLVSVVLTAHLTALGLSATRIGVVVTCTLLGSAALTLVIGYRAQAYPRRRVLQAMSLLMVATGFGFALFTGFWALVVVGLVGTLNPSSGDVSAFGPTEQAVLPATVPDAQRTAIFARYSLLGTLIAALGAALAGAPEWVADRTRIGLVDAFRLTFVLYAVVGVVVLARYRGLSTGIELPASSTRTALGPSKGIVYRLAALFSLDSFGGGFTITAIVVLWLQQRFDLTLTVAGAIFFWSGLLSAWSQLLAPRLAARIGLIRTMAFTHLPANVFLVAAAFMPTAALAVGCLLCRAALSQMDVPARSSYVMAVVTPEERPAAASVTGVPRSLATALPPIAAGWMLSQTSFGWPLVIGGTLKIIYDLLLLRQFRHVLPPEECSRPRK